MTETRRWGKFTVLNEQKTKNGSEVKLKRLDINDGMNISYQKHLHREEIWEILNGEGTMIIDGIFFEVQPGDIFVIPQGAWHSVRAVSDLMICEMQVGNKTDEDDIIRTHIEWDDIVKEFCKINIKNTIDEL